jgi:hypothetical protein
MFFSKVFFLNNPNPIDIHITGFTFHAIAQCKKTNLDTNPTSVTRFKLTTNFAETFTIFTKAEGTHATFFYFYSEIIDKKNGKYIYIEEIIFSFNALKMLKTFIFFTQKQNHIANEDFSTRCRWLFRK